MIPIFFLTLRSLARGRRLLAVVVLLAVPTLLSGAYLASAGPHGQTVEGAKFALTLFEQLGLPVLAPLTALIFSTTALGGEIEDRTLLYLTLRPVARLTVIVAKLLAAAFITVVLLEVAMALAYLVATRGSTQGPGLTSIVLATLGGSLAYSSLFLLVGLYAPRRALITGFIYVLAWEGLAASFSTALATLSVRRYIDSVLHAALGHSDVTAALQPAAVDGTAGVLVLCGIVLASVAASTELLRRLGLP